MPYFSYYYPSTYISVFAGLGLLFWASILIFIRSEDYVESKLLKATNLSYLASLDEMLRTMPEMSGKAVYLPEPPHGLAPSRIGKGIATSRVYFFEDDEKTGTPSAIVQEKVIAGHLKDSIIAPGNDLLKLFEETLGKRFAGAGYSFFERAIPRLIEDDFELAQKVEIETLKDSVKIRLKNPIDPTLFVKAEEQHTTVESIGLPMTSAMACALANSTQKPVVIKGHRIDDEGKKVEIAYAMLSYEEAVP